MKKRWVIFFIVLNAAILSVSVFCLVLTGRNVHLFNQDPDVSIHEEGEAYVMTATSGSVLRMEVRSKTRSSQKKGEIYSWRSE